jgi:SNF2 family DNA or RNA helicase
LSDEVAPEKHSRSVRKTLIYTQYREMGQSSRQIKREKFGAINLVMHGGVFKKRRDEVVESFQNERLYRIFILPHKIGAMNLNLTAASSLTRYELC